MINKTQVLQENSIGAIDDARKYSVNIMIDKSGLMHKNRLKICRGSVSAASIPFSYELPKYFDSIRKCKTVISTSRYDDTFTDIVIGFSIIHHLDLKEFDYLLDTNPLAADMKFEHLKGLWKQYRDSHIKMNTNKIRKECDEFVENRRLAFGLPKSDALDKDQLKE